MLIASNASFSLHGCHFSNAQTGIYTTAPPDEFYGVVLPHVNSVPTYPAIQLLLKGISSRMH